MREHRRGGAERKAIFSPLYYLPCRLNASGKYSIVVLHYGSILCILTRHSECLSRLMCLLINMAMFVARMTSKSLLISCVRCNNEVIYQMKYGRRREFLLVIPCMWCEGG